MAVSLRAIPENVYLRLQEDGIIQKYLDAHSEATTNSSEDSAKVISPIEVKKSHLCKSTKSWKVFQDIFKSVNE